MTENPDFTNFKKKPFKGPDLWNKLSVFTDGADFSKKDYFKDVGIGSDNPNFQDRFEWFGVSNFLHSLAMVADSLDLRPEDLIHIGGVSLFYRCYEVFGSSATMSFRGTRDMDVISFRQGSVRQVLDTIVHTPRYQVGYYEGFRDSFSLPDKKSVTLELHDSVKGKRKFEVDLYESSSGNIRFNNRVLSEAKVILDPPEKLAIPYYKGLIAVPSLRDAFVIKMDIVDYSKAGLRPKDQLDVLTILRIFQEAGKSIDGLLTAIIQTSEIPSALNKLSTLEQLFLEPRRDLQVSEYYPFIPSLDMLTQAIKDVRRFRDTEIYK